MANIPYVTQREKQLSILCYRAFCENTSSLRLQRPVTFVKICPCSGYITDLPATWPICSQRFNNRSTGPGTPGQALNLKLFVFIFFNCYNVLFYKSKRVWESYVVESMAAGSNQTCFIKLIVWIRILVG